MATDRYLFFSNSASSDLICAGVKAVRGRFLRSSGTELNGKELVSPPLHVSDPLDVLHARVAVRKLSATPCTR